MKIEEAMDLTMRMPEDIIQFFEQEFDSLSENQREQGRELYHLVRAADVYVVTPDVQTLTEEAWKTFQPEAWISSDFLSPCGIVFFDRPIDFRGHANTNALAWSAGEKIHVHDDEKWSVIYVLTVTPNDNSAHMRTVKDGFVVVNEENAAGTDFVSFLQVFNRLASQKIVVRDKAVPSRAARRRAQRAEFTNELVVVTLRRVEHSSQQGDSPVDWQHRWLVRGHWRNQWYESTKDHRQLWIAPYIKGPDDKPFVAKRRGFDFKR